MTDATATPFNMNEQGFLQTIDHLIERLGRFGPGSYTDDSERVHPERSERTLPLFDGVVHDLGGELFGGTSWPVNIDMDMMVLDQGQIDHDMEFLAGCRNVVRKYGMSVWLYEMINDASIAVALDRPSGRMPFQLGLFDTRELLRADAPGNAKRRTGGKKRRRCMEEYLRQTYRLAAYSLLRWGDDEPRAADTALMLLAYGGLGMCMLRDDADVVALGCDPNFRYRNVVDHLRDIRIRADLDYACSADLSVSGVLTYPDCMDARYIHDARKLVEAYRALWDERTKPAAQVMAELEDNGPYEVADIWKDPLHLHDLAISLLGPTCACRLNEGFRLRDRRLFERGVAELNRQVGNVGKAGLLMTLASYIFFAEPDDRMAVLFASRKSRRRMLEDYVRLGDMAATIALYRLPRDRISLRAVRALFMHETNVYAEKMGSLMGIAGEPDDGREEFVPMVG